MSEYSFFEEVFRGGRDALASSERREKILPLKPCIDPIRYNFPREIASLSAKGGKKRKSRTLSILISIEKKLVRRKYRYRSVSIDASS